MPHVEPRCPVSWCGWKLAESLSGSDYCLVMMCRRCKATVRLTPKGMELVKAKEEVAGVVRPV